MGATFEARYVERRIREVADFGRGRVHSVYANSLNVCFDGCGGLVTILNPTPDVAPASIVLAQRTNFADQGIEVGESARFFQGGLSVGPLSVATKGAIDRSCVLPRFEKTRALQDSCYAFAERVDGNQARFRGFFDPRVERRLAAAQRQFEKCLASQESIEDAVRGLVGLGCGLTPSGDDFLVGAFAVLLSLKGSADPAVVRLHAHLADASDRTTDISRWMIHYALGGRFRESLIALIEACATGAPLDGPLELLWSVGASSGFDMSCGVLCGLRACIAKKEM